MIQQPTVEEKAPLSSGFRFFLLCALIALGWYLGIQNRIDIRVFRETLLGYPIIISGPIFIGIYIVSTMLVLIGPKDVLRISSALLFGGPTSAILVTIAELGNASILFFMSRTLGRDYVEEKFKLKQKRSMYEAQKETAFLSLLAIRVNPLIPFRFMDIGFGLTNVSFFKYFIAILIASPVRVYWLQMIIAGVGDIILENPMAVMDYLAEHPTMIAYSAAYFGLIAVLTIAALIAKYIRSKMAETA